MLLRPIDDDIVGTGTHRSGWPFAMSCLRPLFHPEASIVFDDFAEKTFFGIRRLHGPLVYREPWIGAFHHPSDVPDWYLTQHLSHLAENTYWKDSLPNLKFILTLGKNLSDWFRSEWGVPCVTLKHPTEVPEARWSTEGFASNPLKRLVQIGWYARNTHAIYQVRAPSFLKKSWLKQDIPEVSANHEILRARMDSLYPSRKNVGDVEILSSLSNPDYDTLLSRNVVFIEFIASVANNTVIECIARNTPIILNRHAGPEYYLGSDYPLFFDSISDVPELLSEDRIFIAHEYLERMDKQWINGDYFRDSLREACLST